ncbi:MAG: RHS repeat-associated core domain-containing protein [Saprospiraceae bacterium]|nr:RHS repeat-associated core domain-containing protein [Saprospiraceae bacterium]
MEYTYNGKEFLDDLGVNLHYYGFRVYDPAVGRFTSVDPIAEKFAFVSGFNYAENDPFGHIDLHGLQQAKYYLHEGLKKFMKGWTNVVDQVKVSASNTYKKIVGSKSNDYAKHEISTSVTQSTVIGLNISQFLDESSYDRSNNYIGGSILEIDSKISFEPESKITINKGPIEASLSLKDNLREDKKSVTLEGGLNFGVVKASIFNNYSKSTNGNSSQKSGIKTSITTSENDSNKTSFGLSIYIEH